MSAAIRQLAERLIAEGAEDLAPRDRRVLEHMARRLAASHNWSADYEDSLTLGQASPTRWPIGVAPGPSSSALPW